MDNNKDLFYCSFCYKSHNEARGMIVGPSVYICNECVATCAEIFEENLPGWSNGKVYGLTFAEDKKR